MSVFTVHVHTTDDGAQAVDQSCTRRLDAFWSWELGIGTALRAQSVSPHAHARTRAHAQVLVHRIHCLCGMFSWCSVPQVLAALAAVLNRGAGPAAAALAAEVPARSSAVWHEKGHRYCYTDALSHGTRWADMRVRHPRRHALSAAAARGGVYGVLLSVGVCHRALLSSRSAGLGGWPCVRVQLDDLPQDLSLAPRTVGSVGTGCDQFCHSLCLTTGHRHPPGLLPPRSRTTARICG